MAEEIPSEISKQKPSILSTGKELPNNITVIEIENNLPFLMNSKNGSLGAPVSPYEKKSLKKTFSKTYSKKQPVAFNPCVSFPDESISVIGPSLPAKGRKPNLKMLMKTPEMAESSMKSKPSRKRLSDSNLVVHDCPVHKRRKKQVPVAKPSQIKVNGNAALNEARSSRSGRAESPDSDIEIIEIVRPSTSKASFDAFKRAQNDDTSRRKRQVASPLKPSSYSSDDVPINVADTAPNLPSYSDMPRFSGLEPNSSFQSSTKWLSANGTLTFSATGSKVLHNGNGDTGSPASKFNDKFHLCMPEIKAPQTNPSPQKRGRMKRELEGLYKNLNEISWAHEKSFKQLLEQTAATTTDNRHSERITAKVIGSKTLRRPSADVSKKETSSKQKLNQTKRDSAKFVLNRVKSGGLKQNLKLKTEPKQKVSLVNSGRLTKSSDRPRKVVAGILKPSKSKFGRKTISRDKDNKSEKRSLKTKVLNDKKISLKPTVESSDASVEIGAKVKKENEKAINKTDIKKSAEQALVFNPISTTQPVDKPTKSILKKPITKVHFKEPEPKSGPKNKLSSVDKEKCSVTSLASSSKTWNFFNEAVQNSAGNCSYRADDSNGLFSAFEKNFFRSDSYSEYRNAYVDRYDNEVQIIKPTNNGDKGLDAAVRKGSKLRVSVEPLEHTKLWNSDFFESFKRHVLEQAVLQTFERGDHEFINTMFQELEEACFHPPNNLKPIKKKKSSEEEVLRSSVRQIGRGYGYKEIFVKKMDNYLQFVLLPHACKLNSLNIEAIKELKEAFIQAKKDPSCRAVLLNSSGTYFCTGIELSLLIGGNRKQAAEEMASSIRDLVLTLSTFTKPIVAAVNGTAVGLGVALLTYCDIVLASDKATFCIPATRLGYLPEGGITLTLPQVVGSGVATEMLLYGRRLTAEQALRHGLISEVLWPTQLMNEVVPRMQTICSQPLQVMEATKTMVRCHLWDKLKTHMERECRLLPPLWLDAQCQHNLKRTLATGWLVD